MPQPAFAAAAGGRGAAPQDISWGLGQRRPRLVPECTHPVSIPSYDIAIVVYPIAVLPTVNFPQESANPYDERRQVTTVTTSASPAFGTEISAGTHAVDIAAKNPPAVYVPTVATSPHAYVSYGPRARGARVRGIPVLRLVLVILIVFYEIRSRGIRNQRPPAASVPLGHVGAGAAEI